MPIRRRHTPLLSDEAVFYAEQWTALAIGVACLATALWATVHDYGLAGSTHRFTIGEFAFFLANWLLTIAAALIGVVLLRFAFRGRSSEEKILGRTSDEFGRDRRGVGEVSNLAHAARTDGGNNAG